MSAHHGPSERLLHYTMHKVAYHGFGHHHRYTRYPGGVGGWTLRLLAFTCSLPMLLLAFGAAGLMFYVAGRLLLGAFGIVTM